MSDVVVTSEQDAVYVVVDCPEALKDSDVFLVERESYVAVREVVDPLDEKRVLLNEERDVWQYRVLDLVAALNPDLERKNLETALQAVMEEMS